MPLRAHTVRSVPLRARAVRSVPVRAYQDHALLRNYERRGPSQHPRQALFQPGRAATTTRAQARSHRAPSTRLQTRTRLQGPESRRAADPRPQTSDAAPQPTPPALAGPPPSGCGPADHRGVRLAPWDRRPATSPVGQCRGPRGASGPSALFTGVVRAGLTTRLPPARRRRGIRPLQGPLPRRGVAPALWAGC